MTAVHDLYVSRYVARSLTDLVTCLGPARGVLGRLTVETGEPRPLHEGMWLVPVAWTQGATTVVRGNLRVMAVARGRRPVTELLLVADEAVAVDVGLEGLLKDLLDLLVVERPPAVA